MAQDDKLSNHASAHSIDGNPSSGFGAILGFHRTAFCQTLSKITASSSYSTLQASRIYLWMMQELHAAPYPPLSGNGSVLSFPHIGHHSPANCIQRLERLSTKKWSLSTYVAAQLLHRSLGFAALNCNCCRSTYIMYFGQESMVSFTRCLHMFGRTQKDGLNPFCYVCLRLTYN